MLNKDLHRAVLINALSLIYSDSQIRNLLGFKGGTAAMLFYELPRFSVDLDFDLLDESKKELVFERLKQILPRVGRVDQAQDKNFTLFFLIDYKKGERNLKVEISKRSDNAEYQVRNYLGIPMLVMKEDDAAAGKLAALTTRKRFATRDMYDMWFFLKENWSIDESFLLVKTNLSLQQALEQAKMRIKDIKKTELLAGLGDLLDNKQKAFVKEKLVDELTFQLNLRQSLRMSGEDKISDPGEIPVLDIEPSMGGQGGPTGHSVYFQAINTGEKVAIDCHWGIRGFNYEWRSEDIFVLRPGEKRKLEYKFDGEKIFREIVPELNIFFEYKDNRGINYFTRRELVQEKTASFYDIAKNKVGEFHPAVVLRDSKIRKISDPTRKGLGSEVTAEVEVNGQIKKIHIGLKRALMQLFDFSPDELKAAFAELVMRVVAKMLREGNLRNYIFTSRDFSRPVNLQTEKGFDAFKLLRDAV